MPHKFRVFFPSTKCNIFHKFIIIFFLREIFAFYLKEALKFKCPHLLPKCKRKYVLFTHMMMNVKFSLTFILLTWKIG